MLELVQFENGRYGLRNIWTGIVVDHEWRTKRGAKRAAGKRTKSLATLINNLHKKGKV